MASPARTYPVPAPAWVLTYQGVNISADLTSDVIELTYNDIITQKAGDMEVQLQDRARKWQGPWYPNQGDLMNLQIGYAGQATLDCGEFQVDELELTGPPDVFSIRGIATFITPSLRTLNATGFENQTLLQIATTIASKHGFTVVGAPSDINVLFSRVTQNRETDLGFLTRISNEHGYDFNIQAQKLIFYALPTLEARPPVATIHRTDVEKFEFKGLAYQTYQGATVAYQDPDTKTLITGTATAPIPIATGDTLKIVSRAENAQQAKLKAESELHQKNMFFDTGVLDMPGDVALVGGANINVQGFGVYDAKYFIMTAHHKMSRDTGFTTQIEIRRLPS